MPTFSIILPTKNREILALHAIKSILNQSFDDYELIISDNSDSSRPTKIEEFCQAYPINKLKYYRTSGLSMVDNWNSAMDKVTGENIITIEDKMILYNDALDIIYHSLIKSNSGVVYWSYDNVNDSSTQLILGKKKKREPQLIRSEIKLQQVQKNISREVFTMPRGLCCSVPRRLIELIKCRFNADLFEDTSPDMTSGFKLLHSIDEYWDCGQSLVVVTSSTIGNGLELLTNTEGNRLAYMMGKSGKEIQFNHVESKHSSLANGIIDDYNKIASRKEGAKLINGQLYWRNIIKELLINILNTRLRNNVTAAIAIVSLCKLSHTRLIQLVISITLEMVKRKVNLAKRSEAISFSKIIDLEAIYKNQ